jgi:hypothetical protein
VAAKTSTEFTPTEELILDILVARYRLGDTLWTFESRNMAALRKLEARGLIETTSGVTENTIRASLTDAALIEDGVSWFSVGTTMNHLPDTEEVDDMWTKKCLEQLVDLPQHQCSTDQRAINTAHVLLIQMIARRHPLHWVLPDESCGVILKREWESGKPEMTLTIAPDGRSFKLCRGGSCETTDKLSEALRFTAKRSA